MIQITLSYLISFFLFFPYPQLILCSKLRFIEKQSILPKRIIVKAQKVRGEPGKSSVEMIQTSQYLNARHDNIKLLEDNIVKMFSDINCTFSFLSLQVNKNKN